MRQDIFKAVLVVFFCIAMNALLADHSPETWSDEFHNLFSDSEYQSAPTEVWEIAGSNALIESVCTIDVTAFPDSVTYEDTDTGDLVPIPHAQSGDGFDNSPIINGLIEWLQDRPWLQNTHAQIYIPSGVYNFSDQIVMHSNISLKGAGSDFTELRFLIKSDSIMTQADCRKDAIQINGSSYTLEDRISYAAVCLLKGELK